VLSYRWAGARCLDIETPSYVLSYRGARAMCLAIDGRELGA